MSAGLLHRMSLTAMLSLICCSLATGQVQLVQSYSLKLISGHEQLPNKPKSSLFEHSRGPVGRHPVCLGRERLFRKFDTLGAPWRCVFQVRPEDQSSYTPNP